jgi:hypothetical protein
MEVLRQHRLADVFEHSNADDFFVLLRRIEFPVIADFNFAAVGQACHPNALPGQIRLGNADRDAERVSTVVFGRVDQQPAPTAAKVKKVIAAPQPEFPADVLELLFLGRVQTDV